MSTEQYRLATRVDERHEVRFSTATGLEWLRVSTATTMAAGRLGVVEFTFADGSRQGVLADQEVMSRLAPKADALTPEEADAFARVARDRR